MSSKGKTGTRGEREALSDVIAILQELSDETRHKVLRTVSVFFDGTATVSGRSESSNSHSSHRSAQVSPTFSENRQMSPKAFLAEKNPKTDVERIACLAFYLTHFRETPYFKTADLTKLNTEAAQSRFSNAAVATGNASAYGYLAPATRGQRQLSAAGEMFVNALPDRDSAKQAMINMRRRKSKRSKKKTSK